MTQENLFALNTIQRTVVTHFSLLCGVQEAIEEMRMTFGLFDESGDGALDEEELEKLLRTFGQEPTKEKVFIKYEATSRQARS